MVIEDSRKTYKCPHCGKYNSLHAIILGSYYCLECKKRFDLEVVDVATTDDNETLGIFRLKESENEKK